MALTVHDVMTSTTVSVDPDSYVDRARAMMAHHEIRHLPVVDGAGRVVGLVSDRDVREAVDPMVGIAPPRKVSAIMASDPYVVTSDRPLADVVVALAARRIGCAVVVEKGVLAGIFTTTDALQVLARLLRGRN